MQPGPEPWTSSLRDLSFCVLSFGFGLFGLVLTVPS